MKRFFTLKNVLAVLVVVLLVAQGVTWTQLRQTKQDVKDLQGTKQLVLNELDGAIAQSTLAPIPGQKRLYLPELNISVPLNATTSSARYSYSSYGETASKSGDVRITTTSMTDHSMHVKSCADMVRLKIEAKPDAYSPEQPLYASVTLSDGRMLQIYASSTKECADAWRGMTPQTLAAPFKDARLY